MSLFAALGVLFLHANECFWIYSEDHYWFTANLIESVFYYAVPVFFMITGATLLDYPERYSTKEFFLKRIRKTVIPYIVWSLAGVGYMLMRGRISLQELSFRYIVNGLLNGSLVGIYWFFPVLFTVYACIPLFAYIPKEKKIRIFTYLVIAGFVLNCLIPFVIRVLHLPVTYGLSLPAAGGYLLYLLTGYLLFHNGLGKGRFVLYGLGMAGFILHCAGTYNASREAGMIMDTFKGYTNLPAVLYSAAVFAAGMRVSGWIMRGKIKGIIDCLVKYTFPVYLLQYFIFDLLKEYVYGGLLHTGITSMAYRLGSPFIVFGVCAAVTFLIRKVRFLKQILP